MTNSEQYPVHLFPGDLRQMIWVIQDATHADEAVIGTTLLGVLASAIQGNMDIILPSGKESPSSLWTCCIAESGAGKTAVFNMLNAGIHRFDCEQNKLVKEEKIKYESSMKIWKVVEKVYQKELKEAVLSGSSLDEIVEKIKSHSYIKPTINPSPKVLYSDTTVQALMHGMGTSWPNASFVSDEGSLFFNGQLSNAFSIMNRCWDGSPISVDRKSDKQQIFIESPRLTILLGVQDKQFDKFIDSKGESARDIGGLARMLFCKSNPPKFRLTKREKDLLFYNTGKVKVFNDYTFDQLKKSICASTGGAAKRTKIIFDQSAVNCYDTFVEELEEKIQGWWGLLSDYKDYVRKCYQHVARIAGLFAYYRGEGKIEKETIEDAIALVRWYIDEFRFIFTGKETGAAYERYAQELDAWFDRISQKSDRRFLIKNEIRRYAPNKLREKNKLDGALLYLSNRGIVECYSEDSVVDIRPQVRFDPDEYQDTIVAYRSGTLKFYPSENGH